MTDERLTDADLIRLDGIIGPAQAVYRAEDARALVREVRELRSTVLTLTYNARALTKLRDKLSENERRALAENARLREALRDVTTYPSPEHDEADAKELYRDTLDGVKARARAALQSTQPVEGGWRPIETAPKDGMILCAFDWLPYAKPMFWAEYAGGWRCPSSEDAYPCDPTHWQPLPPPPAQEEE